MTVLISVFGQLTWCVDCNLKNQYYKLILDKEENVLKEILERGARKQLTEEIKGKLLGKMWHKCFEDDNSTQTEENQVKEPTPSKTSLSFMFLCHFRGFLAFLFIHLFVSD